MGSQSDSQPDFHNSSTTLNDRCIPYCLCTNETQATHSGLIEKLESVGLKNLSPDHIISPIPVVAQIIRTKNLRPFLITHPSTKSEFDSIDCTNPNCVVLSDAGEYITYDKLNKAFQVLNSSDNPKLFSLGKGKYYKNGDQLVLDVGPFLKALEYASSVDGTVIGKPSPDFFEAALRKLDLSSQEVVMVGDDIENDVGGAQACGIRGVLVRTGKYTEKDETHPTVKPDLIVDNLHQFITMLIAHK